MTNSTAYQYAVQSRVPSPLPQHQPRLTYFITRPNNVPVPLIPLDELPLSVNLLNMPRVLTPDQTYGLHYVGAAPMSSGMFVLEEEEEQKGGRRYRSPPNLERPALAPEVTDYRPDQPDARPTTVDPIPSSSSIPPWRRTNPLPASNTQASTALTAVLNSPTGALAASRLNYHPPPSSVYTHLPPSGTMPDPDKKEYCTYWILHGDCGFAQQGCRFKHEMPDRKKLREIGIMNVPRWWAEKECAFRVGGGSSGILKKGGGEVADWLKGPGLGAVRKGSSGSETTVESSKASDADGEGSESEGEGYVVVKGKNSVGVKSTVVKGDGQTGRPSPTPPARPNTPTTPQKDSTATTTTTPPAKTPDLLIDFPALIPSPASSTASFKTPTTITQSKAQTTPNAILTRSHSTTPSKVFVPRGESPAHHIAAARQHHQRIASLSRGKTVSAENKRASAPSTIVNKATASSSPASSPDVTRGRRQSQHVKSVALKSNQRAGISASKTDEKKKEAVPLTDLIEEMRQAKVKKNAGGGSAGGLLASRHAVVCGKEHEFKVVRQRKDERDEKNRGGRVEKSARATGKEKQKRDGGGEKRSVVVKGGKEKE